MSTHTDIMNASTHKDIKQKLTFVVQYINRRKCQLSSDARPLLQQLIIAWNKPFSEFDLHKYYEIKDTYHLELNRVF